MYHTAPMVDGAKTDFKFKLLEITLKWCLILLGNETCLKQIHYCYFIYFNKAKEE